MDSLWFNDPAGLIVCFEANSTPDSTYFVHNFSYLNMAYDQDSTLELRNDGDLVLASRLHPQKIVIQFRDDVNEADSLEPRFDYVFFFETNRAYKSGDSIDENEDDEDSSSSSSESSTSTSRSSLNTSSSSSSSTLSNDSNYVDSDSQ